jgi:hypothetical protein
MKANARPSPGVKGIIGTPPKGVSTPNNNSSPSSGLSNQLSSLSSSTHNYHHALNNVMSLGEMSDKFEFEGKLKYKSVQEELRA